MSYKKSPFFRHTAKQLKLLITTQQATPKAVLTYLDQRDAEGVEEKQPMAAFAAALRKSITMAEATAVAEPAPPSLVEDSDAFSVSIMKMLDVLDAAQSEHGYVLSKVVKTRIMSLLL